MNYELKIDTLGELDGQQQAFYNIEGQKLWESQDFFKGCFMCGFIQVSGIGSSSYLFSTNQWGTMDNVRNAAERFAADDLFNVVLTKGYHEKQFLVHPFTEDVMV